MSFNNREDDGINDMLDDLDNFINNVRDNVAFANQTTHGKWIWKVVKKTQQQLYPECSSFHNLFFFLIFH